MIIYSLFLLIKGNLKDSHIDLGAVFLSGAKVCSFWSMELFEYLFSPLNKLVHFY